MLPPNTLRGSITTTGQKAKDLFSSPNHTVGLKMNLPRIQAAVDELDREVPKEDARVLLEQYGGGPDESRIIATKSGLLRLGVEFLKAGVAEKPQTAGLSALLHPESDIGFDSVEVRERLQDEKKDSGKGKIAGIVLFAGMLLVFALAIYGGIALIQTVAR